VLSLNIAENLIAFIVKYKFSFHLNYKRGESYDTPVLVTRFSKVLGEEEDVKSNFGHSPFSSLLAVIVLKPYFWPKNNIFF